MLKCDQPWGREVADLPPKGPQTQSAPEGGKNNGNGDYDDDDDDNDDDNDDEDHDDDDDDNDDDEYNVFSSPQRTWSRVGTRGGW